MCSAELKGVVYSFKRYSVHDGPGIRQTVFFKGCPLHCWWCHNPESQNFLPQQSIRKFKLDGQSFNQPEVIGRQMSVNEVMDEIKKDFIFYDESGGGVTFSGGEPLVQHEFLYMLLNNCHHAGIHTAVDTCGLASPEVLDKISGIADLILYDIKHMYDELHRKYTGVSNASILNNLRWLDEHKKNVTIRFPVIPQINDDDKNMDAMLIFLSKLKHIKKLALLPYHKIALHKYAKLEIENKMNNTKELGKNELNPLKEKFESIGFEVSIGN